MPNKTATLITAEGLNDLLRWKADCDACPRPSAATLAKRHRLLTNTLPQGRLKSAEARQTRLGWRIAVVIGDQRDRPRNRLFDPEFFFCLRLLLAANASIRIDTNVYRQSGQKHYAALFDHIQLLRIIADAGRGQKVRQAATASGGYRDHGRCNAYVVSTREEAHAGRPTKRTHKGRELAIQVARSHFERAAAGGRLAHSLAADEYEALLRWGFKQLDKLPLALAPGSTSNEAPTLLPPKKIGNSDKRAGVKRLPPKAASA